MIMIYFMPMADILTAEILATCKGAYILDSHLPSFFDGHVFPCIILLIVVVTAVELMHVAPITTQVS